MNTALRVGGFIAFSAFGIAQIVAGFADIDQGIGSFREWAVLIAGSWLLLVTPGVFASIFSLANR